MAETQTLLKVTQEKLPDSQLGLEVEIPPELSQKIYDQVVNKFVRSADIPGFRKGKVPRQVVMQRLGPVRIKSAAVEELVQSSLEKAIAQEQIDTLGNFQLRSDFDQLVEQYQPGAALTFSASIDVPPQAQLNKYKGLTVKAKQVEFDPQKVEDVLKEQQTERATLIPVEDRPAQAGDVALVDFSGRLLPAEGADAAAEPEEIPGGQATDFQIELTEGRFIAGFVEGVIGMNIGETKEVEVSFPADYMEEELSGRPAVFTITLNELKEKELPVLDDEFSQEISEFKTLAELREFLEKRYRDEADQQTKAHVEAALLDELIKELQVDLPETMVRNEVSFLLNQTVSRLQSQGLDVGKVLNQELVSQMQERLRPEATVRLKRTLILAEVAKQESLAVTTEAIEERYAELLQQMDDRKIDRNKLRQLVTDDLLEEKVVAWLIEHSQLEYTSGEELEVEVLESAPPEESAPVEAPAEEKAAKPKGSKPKAAKPKGSEEITSEEITSEELAPEDSEPIIAEASAPAEESKKTTAKRTRKPKEETKEE
ncbi:MAG: trigger factor [Aphanocapsa sp. GSE-SYN-MK-11-07L]|nr:trigger factor [Aphanocapsa sp. GSE-SYN-MK-11-07L]